MILDNLYLTESPEPTNSQQLDPDLLQSLSFVVSTATWALGDGWTSVALSDTQTYSVDATIEAQASGPQDFGVYSYDITFSPACRCWRAAGCS